MERSVYGADGAAYHMYLNKVCPARSRPTSIFSLSLAYSPSLSLSLSLSIAPTSLCLSQQPMLLRDVRLGAEPADGDNVRRMGRSLSGTVVASRRSRLTATRSFVSRSRCALPPPCGGLSDCTCLISRRWHIAFFSPRPVLFSPCCLSRFFPFLSRLPPPSFPKTSWLRPFLSLLSPSLSMSLRSSRLMSVPLPAYSLSPESLSLFHHHHHLLLPSSSSPTPPPPSHHHHLLLFLPPPLHR